VTTFVADLFHGDGGVASLTDSFDVGAANYLRVWVIAEGGVSVTGNVTFGAQNMTLISGSGNGDILGCYELLSPNSGSQTITVNLNGTSGRCAFYAESRSGVNTSTPSGTPGTDTGESTTASATASSAAGQLVSGVVHATGVSLTSDGGQTQREIQLDWLEVGRSFGAAEKAGAASTTLTWTMSATQTWFVVAIPILPAAGGGSTTTSTLTSSLSVSDAALPSKTSGRIGSDTVAIADAGLDYVFANRLGSDNIVVTDAPMEFYSIHNIEAISETTVTDEFLAWLRRHRVLSDSVTVTDELISSVIGYLIYNSVLTSNVSVTDEALKAAYFDRLAESSLVTADQILTALLIARDLLDGVEVTDSALTAMQRFILLTDSISLEDALVATYVPVVGPATDNPLIRIGFDQPEVKLGGYSVN
jgi:hypothetical protein